MSIASEKEPRQQSLTEEGDELYHQSVYEHSKKLILSRKIIDNIIEQLHESENPSERTTLLKHELAESFSGYKGLSQNFTDFLIRTRTQQSKLDLNSQEFIFGSMEAKVKLLLDTPYDLDSINAYPRMPSSPKINTHDGMFSTHSQLQSRETTLQDKDLRSSKSPSNKSSNRSLSRSAMSSLSSILVKQKAKAEAARVKVHFAEKAAEIERQQAEREAVFHRQRAETEANLKILEQERECSAEEAKLRVISEALEDNRSETSFSDPGVKTEDDMTPQEMVERYVSDQASLKLIREPFGVLSTFENVPTPGDFVTGYSPHQIASMPEPHHSARVPEPQHSARVPDPQHNARVPEPQHSARVPESQHNVNVPEPSHNTRMSESCHIVRMPEQNTIRASATEFIPREHSVTAPALCVPMQPTSNGISELTKYLMRKDILIHRLSQFNDKPENYVAWKASFTSVISDLGITPSEENDLLIKYLGPESCKHAESLRSSNATDPAKGRMRIWERLDQRYGSPELVEASLRERLITFPKLTNRDGARMYELSDILAEMESLKEQAQYRGLMARYDSSEGINIIVNKLPFHLQAKWTDRASRYKISEGVMFPPFHVFVDFVREYSRRANDPSFSYMNTDKPKTVPPKPAKNTKPLITTRKTDIPQNSITPQGSVQCPIHHTNHTLNDCRTFRTKPIEERKEFMREKGICFRCCAINQHIAKDCKEIVACTLCSSKKHCTSMHRENKDKNTSPDMTQSTKGGEKSHDVTRKSFEVNSMCTQLCKGEKTGRSCAKTVPVRIYKTGHQENTIKAYAIIDEQSNRSLATTEFFNLFHEEGDEMEYILSSCAGQFTSSGRRASGYIIESFDRKSRMKLPALIECNDIPDSREEIPTPEVALHHPHLKEIAEFIPALDPDAKILLLIGRDLLEAHHVLEQRISPKGKNLPFAQRLGLGWVIIGEVCLGSIHGPSRVNVNKTQVLRNGRVSLFTPCPNNLQVKDIIVEKCDPLFERRKDDDTPGLSVDDREFLEIMDKGMFKNIEGHWEAPLPFRSDRSSLPNNRPHAMKRAKSLTASLMKKPEKKEHFCSFMEAIIKNGHAELAPPIPTAKECWYLPIFGVYHPKKPKKIRIVFDSSAKYDAERCPILGTRPHK